MKKYTHFLSSSFLKRISPYALNFCFIILALGIAISLFSYGIHFPIQLRVRGDAYSYMEIAYQFASFHDALNYAGTRSPGFPLFDYLFIYLDPTSSFLSKINHISLTLFILHELTSLWICFICVKCRLFKASSIYTGLLFLMLAAYPAMVMHTTTPLTDTFGMDLLLIGFSLFARVSFDTRRLTPDAQHPVAHAHRPAPEARRPAACPRAPAILLKTQDFRTRIDPTGSRGQAAGRRNLEYHQTHIFWIIVSGLLSGGLLGYAILVRPAYWIGVIGFLTLYTIMTLVNYFLMPHKNIHQSIVMIFATILTLSAVILPVMDHCKTRYHTACLLDPNAFEPLASISAGLGSARTIWSYRGKGTPYYPEDFLVRNFKTRCPITSITGSLKNDNTNLVSCLSHAPHLTMVYFLKKLTGLFDTFRMTPYTELQTPAWYIWLARIFSSIAFAGFWILLWEGVKGIWQLILHRRPVSSLIAAAWFFCIIQVSVHTILHVEERYAFAWIPFCIIALFLKIKVTVRHPEHSEESPNYGAVSKSGKSLAAIRKGCKQLQIQIVQNKHCWMWLIFVTLIMLGYFIQVLVWDKGVKHPVRQVFMTNLLHRV